MPPKSPLPPRHGLSAAWMRTPDRNGATTFAWATMRDWLRERIPAQVDVDAMLADARFVYGDGTALLAADPYVPQTFVWFHRDLRDEPEVPGTIHVVHQDARLVVVDKPPFLSSIPRGRHVTQSVVVKMRAALGLPELSPVHRLDRGTSGLLMLATTREWRGPYQSMFARREVRKTYRALAPVREDLDLPLVVRNHIEKERGAFQARVVPDAPPNSETLIELESRVGEHGVYRLSPTTGRTHQLRVHMYGLGVPILNDPLYPVVRDIDIDAFENPLQLLAARLEFTDPVDGSERTFESVRSLPLEG